MQGRAQVTHQKNRVRILGLSGRAGPLSRASRPCGIVKKFGGRDRDRTGDLLVANEALSQLSYSPTSSKSILAKAQVLANTRSTARKHVGRSTYPDSAGMLRPNTETYSASGPYGCSIGPPARCATIFLAF